MRAQPVRDALGLRHEHRLAPPGLGVEAQQLAQDHEQAEHDKAAQQAEQQAEQAVQAAEDRQPHEVPDSAPTTAPTSSTRMKMMPRATQCAPADAARARRPDAARARPELPGEEEREDPGDERNGLAQEAAHAPTTIETRTMAINR